MHASTPIVTFHDRYCKLNGRQGEEARVLQRVRDVQEMIRHMLSLGVTAEAHMAEGAE